jgi:hypothetical protein
MNRNNNKNENAEDKCKMNVPSKTNGRMQWGMQKMNVAEEQVTYNEQALLQCRRTLQTRRRHRYQNFQEK